MQTSLSNAVTLRVAEPAATAKLGLVALVLVCLTTWALSHGYQGIRHDARLYTLQALAHLHPASLSNDVFLRYGSQDHFTIFSSLYAALIQWLGIEPAAAALTLASQVALLLSAALLARRVAPGPLTLLGVSVLISIPGFYGADRVFTCLESFVTPRMGAEALTLLGLAAAFSSRPRLAFALVGVGTLLHPIIALAGLVALAFLYLGIPRPHLTASLLGGGIVVLIVAALILPAGGFGTFDAEWLALIRQRSPYLFVTSWSVDDWGRTATPLATLAIGLRILPQQRARTLCLLALLTALSGLVLTLIAADGLRLVLPTQLQPWRWQWLAVVVAAVLIPSVAAACWSSSNAGRTAITLLAAAWLCAAGDRSLMLSGAAIASLVLAKWSTRKELHLVLVGAVGLLAVIIAERLADNLLFLDSHYYDPQIALWIRKAASFSADGGAPIAVALLAIWLAGRPRAAPVLALLSICLLVVCAALAPDAWRRWSQQQFPHEAVARFAPWRAQIPPGADVYWSESALESWILLERPSYISVDQGSGMVFSRTSALELERRARALSAAVAPDSYLRLGGVGAGIGASPAQLERACATSEFEFLVTGARLSWRPVAELPAAAWHSSGGLRLYRCSQRAG